MVSIPLYNYIYFIRHTLLKVLLKKQIFFKSGVSIWNVLVNSREAIILMGSSPLGCIGKRVPGRMK